MEKEEQPSRNWSEAAEDLAAAGDIDAAISLLESVVSNLQSYDSASQLQLPSALSELAALYSSKGFSLKADQLQTRASLIKLAPHPSQPSSTNSAPSSSKDSDLNRHSEPSPPDCSSDDDWEAIADREPDELLASGVSNLKLENAKSPIPKRRGRGTFSYEKKELYSDQLPDSSFVDVQDEETETQGSSQDRRDAQNSKYGTGHVLVLADFPPSTREIELEKLFEGFKDRGFAIRWVSDTVALIVFRTPSVALEARNRVRCPFSVRILNEDDALLSSLKAGDLDPPRQRPKTSAQAAQRLIAHGMGLKLPSTGFGSREHRKQEGARKERIVTRQKLRDEAWGDD